MQAVMQAVMQSAGWRENQCFAYGQLGAEPVIFGGIMRGILR